MRGDLNQKTWFSTAFTNAYQKLDEGWQTKLALYAEMCGVVKGKFGAQSLQILDLGGGLGTAAILAHQILGRANIRNWIVFDLARPMMQQGNVFGNPEYDFVSFVEGNLLHCLPFKSGFFDVVYSTNVLYQFTDEEHVNRIVPEILRILKDGGILIVSNPVPKANLGKIISFEVTLRRKQGWSFVACVSVLYEIFRNLSFLSMQRKLVATANKKNAEVWAAFYEKPTHSLLKPFLATLSTGYAEQVSIVGWVKRNVSGSESLKWNNNS